MENKPDRPTTIVCTELPAPMWKKVRHALGNNPKFVLLQCPAIPEEVLALCERLSDSVLLTAPDFVKRFRNGELLAFSQSGRLQVLALAADTQLIEYDLLLRAGCSGILPAKSSAEMLRKAVHAVNSGEMWAPRLILSRFARESLLMGKTRRLTSRETQILALLASNYKNQEIADHLFISRETVRWHLRSVYSKIGVAERIAAVEYARRTISDTPKTD